MIVDMELEIDGWNIDSFTEIESFIKRLEEEIDSIYPIHYTVRYCEQ